jgi:superoxide dismutase, Fe-Mn family
MDAGFGGFAGWRADVVTLARTRGIGWVLCCWDPAAERLANVWVDLHQLGVPPGMRIAFVLDLWEHAYWDGYGPQGRAAYVEAMLDATRWDVVERRVDG